MFATLQELKNLFGRSFVLGVFFPVLIIVTVSLDLYLEVFRDGLGATLASQNVQTELGVFQCSDRAWQSSF